MENQFKQLTSQLCSKEKQISERELLKEIYLILKGEFVARFECDGNYILITFLNGQKFRLAVCKE